MTKRTESVFCDRCGKRIYSDMPHRLKYDSSSFSKIVVRINKFNELLKKMNMTKEELLVECDYDDVLTDEFSNGTILIDRWCSPVPKSIDLCPKCNKEFKKFMKMKDPESLKMGYF